MHYSLYEFELEELVDDLMQSMLDDHNDYIFSVTENNGHVAMVLIEKSGQVYVNEQAREKLKHFWPAAYESNMQKLIPVFARQLDGGDIPVNGVHQV
jgi:frataxin-like iron-binding protein CyaY